MTWLTLVITLLTYLMQPRNTSNERRLAIMRSALAGAATYTVTHNTDWGRATLGEYDGVIDTGSVTGTTVGTVSTAAQGVQDNPKDAQAGFWNKLNSTMGGLINKDVLIGAGAGAALSGNTGLLIGAGILLLLVIK